MKILKLNNVQFFMSFKACERFLTSIEKRIIFAGDFNTCFISKLELRGNKPLSKRKCIIKLADIKERLDNL